MSFLLASHEKLQPHYDVVVVGSGYGGGVAASRLARMGYKVAVLEKGRAWRPGDFSNSASGLFKRIRLTGKRLKLGKDNALFDFRIGAQMHVLMGRGLGGGSLVNAGLAFRPRPEVFKLDAWPQQLAADSEFQWDFAEAERMLGVATCPDGEQMQRFKRLQDCAEVLNGEAEPAASTINFEPGENAAGVMQPACVQCGDCWTGCNMGAKNTVAVTYLADAFAHGAQFFTNMGASFVRADEDRWRVFYERTDDDSGKLMQKGSIVADKVILSAGVFGSTEILMRSQERGLSLSPRLGQGVSANGDELAFGQDMPKPANGVATGFPRLARTEPVGPNCIGMIKLQNGEEALRDDICIQGGSMLALMSSLAPLKSLLRAKPLRAFRILKSGPFKGVLSHTLSFYVVGHDSAKGQLGFDNGRLRLDWPGVSDESVFKRIKQTLTKMLDKLGGEYMQNPLRDKVLGGKSITVHPLGGCAMGTEADTGVVDHQGRVFNPAGDKAGEVHEGLYVVDGSIIPSSLAANPLLTITALAERSMRLLAAEQGRKLERNSQPPAQPGRDAFM